MRGKSLTVKDCLRGSFTYYFTFFLFYFSPKRRIIRQNIVSNHENTYICNNCVLSYIYKKVKRFFINPKQLYLMKKGILFAAMLVASALGSDLFAQFDASKTYVIINRQDAAAYMQDNGTGIVAIGTLNCNSYWKFVATGKTDCYYVKNALTGKYMQSTNTSEQAVATGTSPVEICVKHCSAEDQNNDAIYGFASTDQTTYNFTSGTIGANRDNARVQGFAAVAGTNHKSFWKVVEKVMPQLTGLSSPYEGVAPAVGTEYYLYNLKTGKWLGDNHVNNDKSWTSHGELGPRGRDIELKAGNAEGRFQLNPKLGHNYSINGSNLYMDTGEGVTNWIFTPVAMEGVTNCYILTTPGGKAMGATSAGWATSVPNDIAENGNVWQLVSREQRLAAMQVGDDCSWLVLGGTFPIDDSHKGEDEYRVWGGDYGSNSIGGDGYYHCNRVWELWGISNRDVYQDITLPNGKYKFKAQAIYVSTGGVGMNEERYNEYLADPEGNTKGVVYANAATTPMINVYSLVTNEKVDDKNTKEIKSGVWAYNGTNEFSTNMFEGKGWTDEVEVEVKDGKLRVGAKVEGGANTAWMLLDNFTLTYLGPTSESVTVTSAGYATYCSENALDFTSTDIKAYVGTKTGDKLTFTPINQVPANTGLLLVCNGGKTEDVPVIASASAVENNCLVGVNAETTLTSDDYILNVVNSGAGFYKAGSFTTLGAHKAYIPAAVGNGVKGFTIDFDDDATGISLMEDGRSQMEDGAIYNVAGQRLSKTQKGINIVNGKKIAVK